MFVDTTIINAPSSTKSQDNACEPEMHQTMKGNQWNSGMKARIGMGKKPSYTTRRLPPLPTRSQRPGFFQPRDFTNKNGFRNKMFIEMNRESKNRRSGFRAYDGIPLRKHRNFKMTDLSLRFAFACAAIMIISSLSACDKNDEAGSAAIPAAASDVTVLFVSQPATQSVLRINASEGKILKEIMVGMLPHNFRFSQDGSKLYVVLTGSQAVAELDVTSGTVLRTFLTEPVPKLRADKSVIKGHIDQNAFSHNTCYDCHRAGKGAAEPAIVGSRPFGMVLSQDGKTMFVCNGQSGNLSVIDLASGKLKKLLPLPPSGTAREPTDIALLDGQLFITMRPQLPSSDKGAVRRLDAATLEVMGETPTGANAGVILADTSSHLSYVSNFETNTISRLDAKGVLQDRITVGTGPFGLNLLTGKNRMIVANYYDNSISVINLDDKKTQTIPLKFNGKQYVNPTHIALDASQRTAYIVSSGTSGNLLALDLESRQLVSTSKLGSLPFAVVTAPK